MAAASASPMPAPLHSTKIHTRRASRPQLTTLRCPYLTCLKFALQRFSSFVSMRVSLFPCLHLTHIPPPLPRPPPFFSFRTVFTWQVGSSFTLNNSTLHSRWLLLLSCTLSACFQGSTATPWTTSSVTASICEPVLFITATVYYGNCIAHAREQLHAMRSKHSPQRALLRALEDHIPGAAISAAAFSRVPS